MTTANCHHDHDHPPPPASSLRRSSVSVISNDVGMILSQTDDLDYDPSTVALRFYALKAASNLC